MGGCFKVIRWILSILLSIILVAVIVIGLPLAGLAKNISNKENLKRWVKDGGVYENAGDIAIEIMGEQLMQQGMPSEIPFSDEEMKELFSEVFSKEWLQVNIEKVIDAFYVWLEGDTKQPTFQIDFSDRQEEIIDGIVEMTVANMSNLPECTDPAAMESYDLLTADCIPPGLDSAEVEEEIRRNLEEQGMFQQGEVGSQAIPIDPAIGERAQQVFKILKNVPTIILVVIIIISLLLFFLVPGLKASFLFTGIVWVVASAMLLIGGYIVKNRFDTLFNQISQQLPTIQYGGEIEIGENMFNLIRQPFQLAFNDVLSFARQQAIIFTVLGMIFVFGGIVLYLSKRRYYIKEEEKDEVDDQRGVVEPSKGEPKTELTQSAKPESEETPSEGGAIRRVG